MTFRKATYLSVSMMAMALVLPTAALADPLIITNPNATTTNNGQVPPGTDVDSVNITGNLDVDTGPAIHVGDVDGEFANSGTVFSSNNDGVLIGGSVGDGFINSGDIDSTGGFGVRLLGDIDGGVNNSGNISGDDAFYVVGNVSGGFINSGNIVSSSSAVYILGNLTGGFTNTSSGFIDGGSSYGVFIGGDVTGDFSNSGEITGYNNGVILAGNLTGNFFNAGRIHGVSSAVYIDGSVTGNFTNTSTGVIESDSRTGVYIGGNFTGNFTNAGKILAGENTGVYVGGNFTGNFSNTVTGLIEGGTSYGIGISGDYEGDFNNAGRIVGGGGHTGIYIGGNFTGDFVNSGDITAESTGLSLSGNFTGDFTNTVTGVIDGGSSAGIDISGTFEGDFNNAGQIIGGVDYEGVVIDGDVTGNFVNSGSIIGGETGVAFFNEQFGDFINTSTGVITGEKRHGVYFSTNVNGDFRNAGEITGGTQSTVYIGGRFNGDFVNSGRIANSELIGVYVSEGVSGRLTNSGVIEGQLSGVGISGDLAGGFVNSGSIDATQFYALYVGGSLYEGFENSSGLTGGRTGVLIEGDVTGGFANSGQIAGINQFGVYIGGSLNRFMNSGEIASNGTGFTALVVQSDLIGDYVNTGNMTVYGGEEYAAYVGGRFEGNFTSTWGQGLYGGSDIDIQGKTVTAFVNQYVADGSVWTALEANGTIYGDGPADYQGQNVTDTSVLIDVSVDQDLSDDNELVLAASRNRISGFADSGFGLAGTLDTVIDGLENGGSTDPLTEDIINLVYAQSSTSGELNETLASLSPDVRGAVATASQNLQMLLNAVGMRLIGDGGGAQQVASLMPNGQAILPTADAPVESGLEMWVQGFYGKSSIEEDEGVAGADAGTFGVAAGIDGDNGTGLTLGGAFAYAHSDGEDDSDFTIDSFMPAVYGKWQPDAWYLSAIVSGGYHDVDQSRSGPMGASIDGDYSVSQVTLRGEAGWEIGVGSGVSFTPFVAAAYNYLSTSDFDESGSPFALSVDGSEESFGTYEAGAKANVDLGGASLKAMAGYRWSGLDDVVDAAFSNGLTFGTDMTAELGGAFVDVDLMYAVTPAIQVGVGYDGVFGEDVTANYGSVKVEWTF